MNKDNLARPNQNEEKISWPDDEEIFWPDDEECFFPDEETVKEELDAMIGFSIVCRPMQSNGLKADDDADAETVIVPISRTLALNLLDETKRMKKLEWSADQLEAAVAFFNLLADSYDPDCRFRIATSPLLRKEAALKLLKDPAHDVRKALAQNVHAQALVPVEERLILSEKDVDVRSALLESALKNWEYASKQNEELVESYRQEAQILAAESLRHDSPNVCDFAADVLEKLEKNVPVTTTNDTSSWSTQFCWGVHKQSARFEKLLADRSRWAFSLIEDHAYEDEGVELPLPYRALKKLADTLAVSDFRDTVGLLERLACHPDRFIRAAIARRDDLPFEFYELFKAETDYVVRKALLLNAKALQVLSTEDIEKLIDGDLLLYRDAYHQTKNEKLEKLIDKIFNFGDEINDEVVETLKSKKIGDAVDQALDEI